MSENRLDFVIRETLKTSTEKLAPQMQASDSCLLDEDMADYLCSVLAGEKIPEKFVKHATECELCFSRAALAVSTLTNFFKNRPPTANPSLVSKAQAIPRVYPKTGGAYMKRNKNLFVAGIFFILSFVYSRYFLQFLAAFVVFGFKWVMDTGGSKALIMIYDAWRRRKYDSHPTEGKREDIIRDRKL